MRILICGLSITSSWGNGHATTYRGLVRGLVALGHDVSFFERDQSWYANNRDLQAPGYGNIYLYSSLSQLKDKFAEQFRNADLVLVGSYVPEGIDLGQWVISVARGATAFYDIDTPITLAKLAARECDYISRELVPRYDVYLSFTGGPTLRRLEKEFLARRARPLYCSVDPLLYSPLTSEPRWDLGYMGTYSTDRQPSVEEFVLQPARLCSQARMVIAGPQYPESIHWPENVERISHLAPADHCTFYAHQRFTLNITRSEMKTAGYSPSVRLFEAAACETPIISDNWPGLDEFFQPESEILLAKSASDVLLYMRDLPEENRKKIGLKARKRVLEHHTAIRRAEELAEYAGDILGTKTAVGQTVNSPRQEVGSWARE
jgi:spore maturation protein CgeB